jgi:hypothetical protein
MKNDVAHMLTCRDGFSAALTSVQGDWVVNTATDIMGSPCVAAMALSMQRV